MRRIKLIISFILITTTVSAQTWRQYYDSAVLFKDQKKINEAITYYKRSTEILAKDSFYTNTNAAINNELGVIYETLGQYKSSEQYYKAAKKIKEKVPGKDSESYIRTCSNLNYLLITMGKYEEAHFNCLETYDLAKKHLGDNNIEYARSCRNLGVLNRIFGRFESAEEYLIEAQSVIAKIKGKDKIEYASISQDLGNVYILAGLSEKAVSQLLNAKNIYEKTVGKISSSYANVTNNLGLVYKNLQDFERSEQYYLESKDVRAKTDGISHPAYANLLYNLGDLYQLSGNYMKAEDAYLGAENIWKETPGKEHPDYAKVCSKLGKLYTRVGLYEQAEPLLLLSKEIREKRLTKINPEYAISVGLLGELYFHLKQFEKAENYLIESREVYKKILPKDHPEFFNTSLGLANVFLQKGEYEKAKEMFLEVKKAWGVNEEISFGNRIINEALGNLYFLQKDTSKAKHYYSAALNIQKAEIEKVLKYASEEEQLLFISNIANSIDAYFSFYTNFEDEGARLYDLSLSYRNQIITSSNALRKSILNYGDEAVLKKYQNWIHLKKELSKYYSKGILDNSFQKLEDSANALEKELTKLSHIFKSNRERSEVTYKKIQQSLKPNEAAIEFISFDYHNGKNWTDSIFYYALILKKDESPKAVFLFEERELEVLMRSTASAGKESIDKIYNYDERVKGKNIYEIVWKPLHTHLLDVAKVYYASTGSLHRISFAALPISESKVLSDELSLIQLNTTADILEIKSFNLGRSDNILLFGGINYNADSASLKKYALKFTVNKEESRSFSNDIIRGNTWNNLDGTKEEVNGIKRLASSKYKVKEIVGVEATEEAIKSLDGLRSPTILHIATHGFFNPDPYEVKNDNPFKNFETSGRNFKTSYNPLIRSGLLFAGANHTWKNKPVKGIEDGILTAYEVSNMHLINTKLVVLSACETALGDVYGNEGVYGLQRSFKIAGIDNLVMSLWKVPDVETTEMMQELYKNLFKGLTIEDSFHNAQLYMKNKYRNDPYVWAGWIHVK